MLLGVVALIVLAINFWNAPVSYFHRSIFLVFACILLYSFFLFQEKIKSLSQHEYRCRKNK